MQATIWLIFALALGTFVSEDLALITAGGLAARGELRIEAAIFACFIGIFAGDVGLFLLGRIVGRRGLKIYPISVLVNADSFEKASKWVEANGTKAVFLSRLLPGTRLPVYLAAGVLKTSFTKFAVLFAIAAAIWTPILVLSAMILGTGVEIFSEGKWLALCAVVISGWLLVKVLIRLLTWRGRRQLVGMWRRITRPEFWPLQVFYLPVVVWISILALRFRSLSAFADANPCMPAGGFVGESKSDIYRLLEASSAAEGSLLKYVELSGDETDKARIDRAFDFIAGCGLTYPVVVKPDVGERGKGVRIVHGPEELASDLTGRTTATIVQEFADGIEFSVFYFRRPEQANGEIFSMTRKLMPNVTGDGRSTLEALILNDERAVAIASTYLKRFSGELHRVPSKGEAVRLVDIGTHSKGAIFTDGADALSAELEDRVNDICVGIAGFNFGRFDLRSASIEEFQKGNFKIVELNGVTSESTNIYDPRFSLLDAYRILFRQWTLAFEIGRSNRALTGQSTSLKTLVRLAADM